MEITLEQVERLREKANVSYSQAKDALEHTGGDLLEALIWLENSGQARPPENGGVYATHTQAEDQKALNEAITASRQGESGRPFLERLLDLLGALVRHGLENELVASRNGQPVARIPVLVLLALLVVAFWVAVPLLLAGFIFGCRYSFAGPDLGKEPVNRGVDVVNDWADSLRRRAAGFLFHAQQKHAKASGGGRETPEKKEDVSSSTLAVLAVLLIAGLAGLRILF